LITIGKIDSTSFYFLILNHAVLCVLGLFIKNFYNKKKLVSNPDDFDEPK
jgi:hypothetical protein